MNIVSNAWMDNLPTTWNIFS